LSVGFIFVGLFLAVLGGFGAFHFGAEREQEQEQEKQRMAVVQNLAEIVSSLQEDQRALRQQLAVIAEKGREEPLPPVASGPTTNPPSVVLPTPPVSLASASPVAVPNLLLPHPLAPTDLSSGPAAGNASPPPVVRPPKLPLSPSSRASAPEVPPVAPEPLTPTPPVPAAQDEYTLSGKAKRARLIRHLRSHAGQEIDIRVAARDAGAVKLALALRTVFRESGWTVGELEMVSHQLPAQTLTLSTGAFPPKKPFVAAYEALAAAGFIVASDLAPLEGPHTIALAVGPVR
jgi:hypothetical protein